MTKNLKNSTGYNYLVCGAGKMARAVVYFLNKQPDTKDIFIFDKQQDNLNYFKKKYKNVKPFITTNTSKENIIRRLISDISDGILELPSPNLFNALYKELQMFQYKFLPSGKIQYAAMSGGHDDTFMSLAICNWNRVENPIRKKLVVGSIR